MLGGAATAKPHSHASASGRIASAADAPCYDAHDMQEIAPSAPMGVFRRA